MVWSEAGACDYVCGLLRVGLRLETHDFVMDKKITWEQRKDIWCLIEREK